MIARLESSFELSSFPLEQISIYSEIHLERHQADKIFQVLYVLYVNVYMIYSISYSKRYGIYFMGSEIDDFYPLRPKAKIGEIHSLV